MKIFDSFSKSKIDVSVGPVFVHDQRGASKVRATDSDVERCAASNDKARPRFFKKQRRSVNDVSM